MNARLTTFPPPPVGAEPVTMWLADWVVIFEWLRHVDFDAPAFEHRAQKQALVDLFGQLELSLPPDLPAASYRAARDAIAKDMGW